MSHSILPPSSAAIWGSPDGCTGWVIMSQQYPETQVNDEALDGDASHEIGADLVNYAAQGVNSTTAEEYIGESAVNGVIFTEEMFDAAKIYADDVAIVMRNTAVFGGEYLGVESKVSAKQIHDLSYGTTDTFIFDRHTGHLYVWDYKFGYGIVEAFENWQLTNYTAGIIERFNIDVIEEQNIIVHLRVIQPRAHHRDGMIREWEIKLSDLRGYFNILSGNAHLSLSDAAIIRTGLHCRYCQARHSCPAALQAGIKLFEIAMKPTPVDLSPDSIGVQLAIIKRAIKQLEYMESGFDEQVKALIKKGVLVPNFATEMSFGRLAWTKSVKEVIEMGNLHLLSLQKPIDVITPTQAIALAKKAGASTDDIKNYSTKPRAGLKVVPDNGSKARKIFS